MKTYELNHKTEGKRYGILGGTFDPIHNGHLFIAQTAMEELQLDKVIFIPNRISPHKIVENVTLPYHRVTMTEIGTVDNNSFYVSPIEIHRSGPSYTIDTIRELQMENPQSTSFYFITGADVFMELETWRDYRELIEVVTFVIVTRAGFSSQELDEKTDYFTKSLNGNIIRLRIPNLEISSTDIRSRVKDGKNIKYLVPSGVAEYIQKHSLYKE